MAEFALQQKIKIIAPVRDLREVLSSFEKLWRKQAATGQIQGVAENYFQLQTLEGRCEYWTRSDQPVGLAFNRIKNAIQCGYRDRIHFVDFDNLTKYPEETLRAIYKFLEEPYYEHNFNHVEQVTWEDDAVYGFGLGLHDIRNKVEPLPHCHHTILGSSVANKYNIKYY